jgi:ABC-2 type transport system permease protein
MHNVWLIAKREYLERIRTKAFLVMTVLIPLLLGGLIFGSALINGTRGNASHIVVVTQDAQFGADLQSELQSNKERKITVDVVSPPAADTRSVLDKEIKEKDLDGYLWVTPAASGKKQDSFEWVPKSKADITTKSTIGNSVRTVLTRESLSHSGMGAADVDSLFEPIDLDSTQAGKADGAIAAVGVAYAGFFLMYLIIVQYCMNVGRSILEDKTSRVFEVLLVSARPSELMAGKVLGVGSVGLTQVGIWIAIAAAVTQFGLFSSGTSLPVTIAQAVYFVIFFLLGYVLYSSIGSALAAMTSSQQELQQMNTFLMLPIIACSAIIFRVITDSDGTIAKVFSFIPFCSPLIMYTRIAVHQPPAWQIAIAIAELILSIVLVLWVATRIYRVGILMYGKRPNLPEILRWLKYS